jgi:hypothetical protein
MPTLSTRPSERPLVRQLIWIPALMVAALLYWTVALGMGGRTLMAVSVLRGAPDSIPTIGPRLDDLETPDALVPALDDADSIVVHLQESVEPEDVNDNVGSGTGATAF